MKKIERNRLENFSENNGGMAARIISMARSMNALARRAGIKRNGKKLSIAVTRRGVARWRVAKTINWLSDSAATAALAAEWRGATQRRGARNKDARKTRWRRGLRGNKAASISIAAASAAS
jgi:hypothetical protein